MTLVATFQIDDALVMIGDTLLSGHETEEQVQLPNVENIKDLFPAGAGFVPRRLMQKIVVVNKNLVVGWSGSLVGAKSAIGELIDNTSDEKLYPREELKKYFEGLDDWIKANNSFLVLAAAEEGLYRPPVSG